MNDELERDDLDAWDVEPLGADFEDRVMAALDAPRPTQQPSRNRAVIWATALSLAAAAALAVGLWPGAGPDATDAISIRASASAQLDYTPGSARAEQSRGTVTYRVQSGTPFVVRTPAADITVHGTEFTVEILTMQDERRRKYLGAGALAMGGAAVAVYVSAGQVEVHNEHGRTEVAAGEVAVASEHAGPRSKPAPIVAAAKPVGTPRKTISPREREEVKRRLADALAKRSAPVREGLEDDREEEPDAEEAMGSLDKDYIRDVVREDLVPIAKECYESALEGRPDLAGSVMLEFSIAGDESVGGIVDEVSFAEGALFEDAGKTPPPPEGTHVDTVPAGAKRRPELSLAENPEFAECLSESTASLLFDPPTGGGRVQVTYPFVFKPAGDAPAAD